MKTKICYKCGVEKELSEFYKDKSRKDGLSNRCKICDRINCKQYNEIHYQERYKKYRVRYLEEGKKYREENKDYFKNYRLKRDYSITLENYKQMLESQNGVCAICGNFETIQKSQLSVDHDHKTNKVRGLLCRECNRALGGFKDNHILLQSAINYLNKHKD